MSQLSSQQNNDCRFYGYKHWTLETMPRCFYVGKGLKNRPNQLKGRNSKHRNVTIAHGCHVEICVGPMSHDDVVCWEITTIAASGTYHYDNPSEIGCNFTHGGDGTPGSHHNLGKKKPPFTEEHRQALKVARAKQNMTQHAIAMCGKNKHPRPDLSLRNESRKGTKVRCSLCNTLGHNKRGCHV